MSLDELLTLILSKPEPAILWSIRSALLEAGLPSEDSALITLDEFSEFLNKLVASSTARQYSHFASLLDLGAVGGVALQNLLEKSDSANFTQRLLAGGISEVLMVMAARQYVKAWEEEMKAAYYSAAWHLFAEFWDLSSEMQPDLDPSERRRIVEEAVSPLRNEENSGVVKAAVTVHYYQLLLAVRLGRFR